MKILVLDNYDSFTYNLVQYLKEINVGEVVVFRNDAISLEAVDAFDAIILSPGPGIPEEAGIMLALIKQYAHKKPIFGVCLGHQAIGEAFGAQLLNLSNVFHGIATPVKVTAPDDAVFKDVPTSFDAGRYHSWAVKREGFPACLSITAEDDEGAIMALTHNEYCVKGVQFHPESIMTPEGKKMLRNFLALAKTFNENSVYKAITQK